MATENDPFEGGKQIRLFGHDLMESLVENTLEGLITKWRESRHLVRPISVGTHIATSGALNAGFAVIWWGPDYWLENSLEPMKSRFKWIQNAMEKDLTKQMGMLTKQTINASVLEGDLGRE